MVDSSPTSAGDTRDSGRSLGRDDPLEEEMATHFSTLARRIPWTEEPGGLWRRTESDMTQHTRISFCCHV